MGEHVIGATA